MEGIEPSSKVKYHLGDKKWLDGVVHGIRKIDLEDRSKKIISYLIDTGGDERIDVIKHRAKYKAMNKEFKNQVAKGKETSEAMDIAVKSVQNLVDEIIEEKIRQPKQVEVAPENVRIKA